MSLIEGIGDEVLEFLGIAFVVIVGAIGWLSTNIGDAPQIRTVLILERRSQTTATAVLRPEAATSTTTTSNTSCPYRGSQPAVGSDGGGDSGGRPTTPAAETVPTEVDKEESVVNQVQNIRRRILGQSQQERSDLDRTRLLAEVIPSSDSSEIPQSETVASPDVANNGETESTANEDSIQIRLKYLNDEQKVVQGNLQELLGDFKKRHFSGDLARERRVRLIFNGQVLTRDDTTLAGCGLYDNCVVHCLIHAQAQTNNRSSSATNASQNHNASTPDCNLGPLLYFLLSFILALAWIFRYHYSQFFTLTTTGALIVLTGTFAISVVGRYLPDTDTVAPS